MGLAEAYRESAQRVAELVRALDGSELESVVPACPDWTVRDLVGHLVGVAHAYLTGDTPGASSAGSWDDPEVARRRDAWTAAQVEQRRGRPLEAVLNEWDGYLPGLEPRLTGTEPWADGMPPWAGSALVSDIATHEQDLRAAVSRPGARDSEAVEVALQTFSFALQVRAPAAGVPPLRVVVDGEQTIVGEGDPVATLRADRFEFLRAISGRRSQDDVRAMFVDGDPEPYLKMLSLYPMPSKTPAE